MKGSEVQELAQRVTARSRCYADLVKALQDCYSQQRTVYQHHVFELLVKRKYDYNQADLQEFVDKFKAHPSGFSRNNGSTLDQLMVAIYEEFLGEETLKEWHIYSANTKEPVSAEQFLQFVEERVNAFPTVHAKKPTIKPSAHRASNAKAFVIQAKSNSLVLPVLELRIRCSSAARVSLGIKIGDTVWLKELNFVIIVWARNICCKIVPVTDPAKRAIEGTILYSIRPILLLHRPIQLEFAQLTRLRLCVPTVKSPARRLYRTLQ